MDLTAIAVMLAIGAFAGWLAGLITSGGGFGLIPNILVGIGGALVAGFLFPSFLPLGGLLGKIVSATLGAVILLFAIRLIRRVV